MYEYNLDKTVAFLQCDYEDLTTVPGEMGLGSTKRMVPFPRQCKI